MNKYNLLNEKELVKAKIFNILQAWNRIFFSLSHAYYVLRILSFAFHSQDKNVSSYIHHH